MSRYGQAISQLPQGWLHKLQPPASFFVAEMTWSAQPPFLRHILSLWVSCALLRSSSAAQYFWYMLTKS